MKGASYIKHIESWEVNIPYDAKSVAAMENIVQQGNIMHPVQEVHLAFSLSEDMSLSVCMWLSYTNTGGLVGVLWRR